MLYLSLPGGWWALAISFSLVILSLLHINPKQMTTSSNETNPSWSLPSNFHTRSVKSSDFIIFPNGARSFQSDTNSARSTLFTWLHKTLESYWLKWAPEIYSILYHLIPCSTSKFMQKKAEMLKKAHFNILCTFLWHLNLFFQNLYLWKICIWLQWTNT